MRRPSCWVESDLAWLLPQPPWQLPTVAWLAQQLLVQHLVLALDWSLLGEKVCADPGALVQLSMIWGPHPLS